MVSLRRSQNTLLVVILVTLGVVFYSLLNSLISVSEDRELWATGVELIPRVQRNSAGDLQFVTVNPSDPESVLPEDLFYYLWDSKGQLIWKQVPAGETADSQNPPFVPVKKLIWGGIRQVVFRGPFDSRVMVGRRSNPAIVKVRLAVMIGVVILILLALWRTTLWIPRIMVRLRRKAPFLFLK